MHVLNLYSGLGGNRKHWDDCKVTAVEKDKKIADIYHGLYPEDSIVVGDAHDFLIDHFLEYDFIWASPPCQSHTQMMKATRHESCKKYIDLSLYQEILFLEHHFEGKWIVENVKPYYSPLIPPNYVVGRHYFWSNFDFYAVDVGNKGGFIDGCDVEASESLKKWLGIEYEGNVYYEGNHCPAQVLRNCVHPAIGEQIWKYVKSPINETIGMQI